MRAYGRLIRLSAIAVGTGLVLLGCTPAPPEPKPTGSPSPSATAEPVAYDGPMMFVGDEIDDFLLSPEEIADLLPDVSEVTEPFDGTEMYADGSGEQYEPAICQALLLEQQVRATGARSVEWKVGDSDELGPGTLRVIQLGSVGQAEERIEQLREAADGCASFQGDGASTFTDVATVERDGVRALAGVLRVNASSYDWNAFYAYAQVGNVLVQIVHEFAGATTFASDRIARALADRAEEASEALMAKLTADPPTIEEPESISPDMAVADWPIVFGAVGPMVLGEDAEQAAARVTGAEVTETLRNTVVVTLAESAGRMRLDVGEDGEVRTIEVGGHFSEAKQQGSALPQAEGVRVGDSLSQAMVAFPEGSTLRLISAGTDVYVIADRAGRVIMFSSEMDETAAGDKPISSITVDDASVWTYFRL